MAANHVKPILQESPCVWHKSCSVGYYQLSYRWTAIITFQCSKNFPPPYATVSSKLLLWVRDEAKPLQAFIHSKAEQTSLLTQTCATKHMWTVSSRPLLMSVWGEGEPRGEAKLLQAFIHSKAEQTSLEPLCSHKLVPLTVRIASSNLLACYSCLRIKYAPLVETWSHLVYKFDFYKLSSTLRPGKLV